MIRFSRLHAGILVLLPALVAFAAGYKTGMAREDLVTATPLFSSSQTVLGEPIAYPAGKPKLTGAILTLQPGAETGWHTHPAIPAGILLDGELTVDYGDKGKKTFKKGDSVIETSATPHNGKNTGTEPMRLFVIFVGAEGLQNTLKVEK